MARRRGSTASDKRPDIESRGDLESRADLELLVGDFYRIAFADELLGPLFVDVAHLDLAIHIPVMTDFWESMLWRRGAYQGNAIDAHRWIHQEVGLEERHFERWIALWEMAVDQGFVGSSASRIKLQARRMAVAIRARMWGRKTGPLPISLEPAPLPRFGLPSPK